MQFNSWAVQGFRSFVELSHLAVDELVAGLYHVTGENGAGKSSLFESLFWGLYGTTSRNLRGPAVKSWYGDSPCTVGVGFSRDTRREYELIRSQSPNSLTLTEGTLTLTVDQETVEKHIGLNSDAFLNSIYFAQFTDAFIDLKPEARMQMYASVMNLEYWEGAAEIAHDTANTLHERVTKNRQRKAELDATIATLAETSYDEDINQWEADHAQLIKEHSKIAEGKSGEYFKLDKEYRKLPSLAKRDAAMKRHTESSAQVRVEHRAIDKLREELRRLDTPRDKCPTCGTKLDVTAKKQHMALERKRIESLIALREKDIEGYVKQADAALREADSLNALYARSNELLKKMDMLDADCRHHQRLVEEAVAKTNPWRQKAYESTQRQEAARVELAAIEEDLAGDEQLYEAVKYWVKGYKDVRLGLIEESLEQLNVEINEVVHELGLRGWELRFDVERATKRGTIKRGFQCMVKSPHSNGEVPWEVWSGGESQRLRVASSMGISNLIQSRTGTMSNLELWDEPSTWLNDLGIKDLLDALANRARSQNKVILLADHRALGFGDFAGIIKVDKHATSGSRLVTSWR